MSKKAKAPELPKWKQDQVDQKLKIKQRVSIWETGTTCNLGIKEYKRQHRDGKGVGGYKERQWNRVKQLLALGAKQK